MKRALLAVILLGCGASTSQTPIHTRRYTYRQPNGQAFAKGTSRFGHRHGRWSFFDESGRKLRDGEYRYGVMHGMWTWYFENGDSLSVRYRNGVPVTPDTFATN